MPIYEYRCKQCGNEVEYRERRGCSEKIELSAPGCLLTADRLMQGGYYEQGNTCHR